jgi:hypothetical protein
MYRRDAVTGLMPPIDQFGYLGTPVLEKVQCDPVSPRSHGSLRRRTAQYPSKRGNDGRLRPPDGRDGLIILPPAPKAFVELHELLALRHLRLRILLLS